MNFSRAGLLCDAERTVRAGPRSVCIAEGKVSGQDAIVLVQDVFVIVAETLLSRMSRELRDADASVIVADLSLRVHHGRYFFRTAGDCSGVVALHR